MKKLIVGINEDGTINAILQFDKEDILDLACLMNAVDGYYTPYGSTTAKLANDLSGLAVDMDAMFKLWKSPDPGSYTIGVDTPCKTDENN